MKSDQTGCCDHRHRNTAPVNRVQYTVERFLNASHDVNNNVRKCFVLETVKTYELLKKSRSPWPLPK